MTGPGTNTYLVGHEQVAVIDPGPDDPAHVDAILREGAGRIRWIVATHTHEDHSPAALPLAGASGDAAVWTWSASVEWKGLVVAAPIAAIRIRSSTPRAGFQASALEGEAPMTVLFEDRSLGEVTSWSWDFGDGATSALQNPTHEYTSPGTYSVTLVASNESGVATCTRPELVTVESPVFAIAYGMNASENVYFPSAGKSWRTLMPPRVPNGAPSTRSHSCCETEGGFV